MRYIAENFVPFRCALQQKNLDVVISERRQVVRINLGSKLKITVYLILND